MHALLFNIGVFHNDLHIGNIMTSDDSERSSLTIPFPGNVKRTYHPITSVPSLVAIDFGQASPASKNHTRRLTQETLYSLNCILQVHNRTDFETTILISSHKNILSPIDVELVRLIVKKHDSLFPKVLNFAKKHIDDLVPVLIDMRDAINFDQYSGYYRIYHDPRQLRRACMLIRNFVIATLPNEYEIIVSSLSTHPDRNIHPFMFDRSFMKKIFSRSSILDIWDTLVAEL